MNTEKKLFAFKLAEKQSNGADQEKWTARDGVAIAGCSYGPAPPHGWFISNVGGGDVIDGCVPGG